MSTIDDSEACFETQSHARTFHAEKASTHAMQSGVMPSKPAQKLSISQGVSVQGQGHFIRPMSFLYRELLAALLNVPGSMEDNNCLPDLA